MFRQGPSGPVARRRLSRVRPTILMFLVLVLLSSGGSFAGISIPGPQLFVVADATEGVKVAKKAPSISEGVETLKALSRRLRGGRANPEDILPELQEVVKDQLERVQSMQTMYEDGNSVALASSIRALLGEPNDESKELAALGVSQKDLVLVDTVLHSEHVSDSQVIEHFEPSDFSDFLDPLRDVASMLNELRPLLKSSDFNSRRLNENLSSNKKDGRFRDARIPSLSHTFPPIRFRRKLPDLRKFGVHGRRLNDAPAICSEQCAPTNTTCLCQRLADCAKELSHYDLALLFANTGYIEQNPSNSNFADFSVSDIDLKLFDVDDNAYSKFVSIIDTASTIDTSNSAQCTEYLDEFHTACDPTADSSCSTGNSRSFQLSVTEVCNSINNPTKLLFSAIGEEFDGYASTDGLTTYTTTCGEYRVAYESCRTFIEEFENLYKGRDRAKYPFSNPMRTDAQKSVGDGSEGSILFPTAYNFEQNLHGTDNLAFPDIAAISTSGKDIHVVGSSGLCMDAGFGGDDPGDIYMHSCLDNDNQQYSFDSSTLQIKHTSSSTGTRCLDYDPGSDNVYLNENCFAGLNQKWRFNPLTLEMSTFSDNKCLDWNAGGNDNVTMHDCTGNKNQQWNVPKTWFPDISTSTTHQVRVVSDMNMCLDCGDTGGNCWMADCQDGNSNQTLTFDASTHQLKLGSSCLDYDPSSNGGGNVYKNTNCYNNNHNQMWRYNSNDKTLRTFQDGKCMDWAGASNNNNVWMNDCNGQSNQQFVIPFQWKPLIETTSVDTSVMAMIDGTLYCMDGGKSDGKVYMNSDCDNTNQYQNWFYNATSRQVQQRDQCLDSNDSSGVFMNSCNSGLYQQWHYESYSGQLRHLASDLCLDSSTVSSGDDMMMNGCNGGDYQVFYVPQPWLPAAWLDKIRVVQDGSKCMDARPDSNNNVWLAGCQAGNENQDFYYDSRSLAIKHAGLCLEWDNSAADGNNVYLNECDGSGNQRWNYVASSMQLHVVGNTDCLDWNNANNENNLYLYGCTGADNQKWMMPSAWLPDITSTTGQGSPQELQVAGYTTRPIPAGIWNGQWDKEKGDNCSIDLVKDVLQTCDESMAFLLGEPTSVGTLRDIAKQVNENGPEFMPGMCCLDTPSNSEWFGYYYSPGSSYFGVPMECQNPGPWHLGISVDACSSANGHWFRGPCLTLQKCINDRPTANETGYSQAFENFAVTIVITDPTDDSQCGNARTSLGFDSDYPYDTEVCDAFVEQECDDFYASVDGLTLGLDYGESAPSDYSPEPWETALPFTPLPSPGWSFQPVPTDLAANADTLQRLQYTRNSAYLASELAEMTWEHIGSEPKCVEKFDKEIGEMGVKAPNPVYYVCLTESLVRTKLQWFMYYLVKTAFITLDVTYDQATISPGQEKGAYYYSKSVYENLQTLQQWINPSLEAINQNIDQQHTAVRNELIDYICATVEGLGGTCVDSRRRLEGHEDGHSEPEITWPEGKVTEKLARLLGSQGGVESALESVRNFMAQFQASIADLNAQCFGIGDNDNEGGGSREKKAKSKRAKSKKSSLFLSDESDRRRLMDAQDVSEQIGSLNEKMEVLDGRMSSLEGIMDKRMSSLEDKMDKASERMDSLEDKVDKLSSLMAQLINQNQQLLGVE